MIVILVLAVASFASASSSRTQLFTSVSSRVSYLSSKRPFKVSRDHDRIALSLVIDASCDASVLDRQYIRRRTALQSILSVGYGGDIESSSSTSSSSISSSEGASSSAILFSTQTSIDDALRLANTNARFLICYIAKRNDANNDAVETNLMSKDMIKLANQDPLKKGKSKKKKNVSNRQPDNSEEDKSYYIWMTDNDDDIEYAMKRLKLTPPKPPPKSAATKSSASAVNKSKIPAPILSIICPTTSIDPATSKLRVTPRTLAQHHCRPPPSSPTAITAWAKSVRERHVREYVKLRHIRTEMKLLKERTQGYQSSIREDMAREMKEKQSLAMEEQKKEKERLHLEMLELRRTKLLANLIDEPTKDITDGVITVALRFAITNNNKGNKLPQQQGELRRRFIASETRVNDVFDWIDAKFGYERETLVLSTMNGSKKFVYCDDDDDDNVGIEDDNDNDDNDDDTYDHVKDEEKGKNLTLVEAGFTKMMALRVTEIVRDRPTADVAADKDE
jgi:hypothetical protein